MSKEEQLKNELLKKDKEQLVELYLQKCYDTDVEIEQLKAELDEYKKHDNMCCSTLDEVIKNCDDCKLFECIGCEHSMSAVIEIKQLKAENEMLKYDNKELLKEIKNF